MFLAFFHKKQRCRLKMNNSVARKKAGGRRREDSTRPGVGGAGQPLNSAPPAPTRVACPTSVPERIELYGEARPKPPTLRRRAPKNTKNPSLCWGRAFWPESGVAHKHLQQHSPSPVLRVPKIGKKCRFDTFSRTVFNFSKLTKCCKLQHFCVLTVFAGTMQKRRKHCKQQCFLD